MHSNRIFDKHAINFVIHFAGFVKWRVQGQAYRVLPNNSGNTLTL